MGVSMARAHGHLANKCLKKHIQASIKMIRSVASGSMFGQMAHHFKVSLRMTRDTVWVF